MKTSLIKRNLKNLFLFLLTGAMSVVCHAQSHKISVSNGDWFNPNTWSPAGVPSDNSSIDSIIINTNVTISQSLTATEIARRVIIIRLGASLICTSQNDTLQFKTVHRFENYGTVSITSSSMLGIVTNHIDSLPIIINYGHMNGGFILAGGFFQNKSGAETSGMSIAIDGVITNETGSVFSGTSVTFNGGFTNETGALVNGTVVGLGTPALNKAGAHVYATNLTTSDSLVNNGEFSTTTWINQGAITGVTGKFCVAGDFMNTGDITGTVDICDATPNGPFDFNLGTIASSVTHCTVSPCEILGISDHQDDPFTASVFPNPSGGVFFIEIKEEVEGSLMIFNAMGQQVLNSEIKIGKSKMDISSQPEGVYFLRIMVGDQTLTRKIVINK